MRGLVLFAGVGQGTDVRDDDLDKIKSPKVTVWKLTFGDSRQWDGQHAARARFHGLYGGIGYDIPTLRRL